MYLVFFAFLLCSLNLAGCVEYLDLIETMLLWYSGEGGGGLLGLIKYVYRKNEIFKFNIHEASLIRHKPLLEYCSNGNWRSSSSQ